MFNVSSTGPTFRGHVGTRKQTLLQRLVAWEASRKQMHKLNNMTEHQLTDIGLTRADVEREMALKWSPPIQMR